MTTQEEPKHCSKCNAKFPDGNVNLKLASRKDGKYNGETFYFCVECWVDTLMGATK